MTLLEQSVYIDDLDKVIAGSIDWTRVDGHSVLVIGATGLIGSFMIDVLMRRNHVVGANIQIYAMGRSQAGLDERFDGYAESPLFHQVIGDVTLPLPDGLQTDYIVHAASNTHPRQYATDPIGTIMTNVVGTERVLEHAVTHPAKRILFLSSVEIYGENRGDVDRFKEDYTGYLDPNTLRAGYPEGKRVSESLCQAYIAKYNLDIVIPRICRTFGPTMKLTDSKASSQFLMRAVHDEDIVLKSEGTQYYSYAYVGDVVSALLCLMSLGRTGEAYNIAIPEFDLHLRDLAQRVADSVDRKVIFDLPDATEREGFSKATKALLDATKLNDLGWRSQFGLEEALSHTIRLLRSELG